MRKPSSPARARPSPPAALRCGVLALLLASLQPAAPAQEGLYAVDGGVDWTLAGIRLTIHLDAAAAGIRLPAGRSRAEALLSGDLPELIRPHLFGVAVDSRRSVAEAVESGDLSLEEIAVVLSAAKADNSRFSRDLRLFSADVDLPLKALSDLFIRHSVPAQPSSALSWTPGGDYTGIVIYAEGALPIHGEGASARLEPCLFPKIWDGLMNPVLERNMADPEALRRWGLAAYAASDDLAALEARVGQNPLRILATGVFGLRRTDPVISTEDALRILSRPANRALLREGRVVIVIGRR